MTEGSVSIPPELATRPREVIAGPSRRGVGVWIIRLLAAALAVGAVLALGAMLGVVLWALVGTDQQAAVSGVSMHQTTQRSNSSTGSGHTGSRRKTHYRAQISYAVNGTTYEEQVNITRAEFERLGGTRAIPQPGVGAIPGATSLRVRTLSLGVTHWTMAVCADQTLLGRVAMFWGVGAMVMLFAGILFWAAVVEPRRVQQLYREGIASPGQITAKWTTRRRTTSYHLGYVFVTPEGERVHGKQAVARRDYESAHEDQPVAVLHPEGRSAPSVIYEYGGYTCA